MGENSLVQASVVAIAVGLFVWFISYSLREKRRNEHQDEHLVRSLKLDHSTEEIEIYTYKISMGPALSILTPAHFKDLGPCPICGLGVKRYEVYHDSALVAKLCLDLQNAKILEHYCKGVLIDIFQGEEQPWAPYANQGLYNIITQATGQSPKTKVPQVGSH